MVFRSPLSGGDCRLQLRFLTGPSGFRRDAGSKNEKDYVEEQSLTEPEDPDYHVEAFWLLEQSFQNICSTTPGVKFLMKERENPLSIYNQLLSGHAGKTGMGVLVASGGQDQKSSVTDFNNNSSSGSINPFNAARKINGHAVNLVMEFYPALAKLYSPGEAKKVSRRF